LESIVGTISLLKHQHILTKIKIKNKSFSLQLH